MQEVSVTFSVLKTEERGNTGGLVQCTEDTREGKGVYRGSCLVECTEGKRQGKYNGSWAFCIEDGRERQCRWSCLAVFTKDGGKRCRSCRANVAYWRRS